MKKSYSSEIIKYIIFSFLEIFAFYHVYSQDFELRKTPFLPTKIILKDGTVNEGYLRLASSPFDLRYKNNLEEKEQKINFKNVDSLIIYPRTIKERIFQYLPNNQDKFDKFVELIFSDTISIYSYSIYPTDRFYSDIDRRTIRELFEEEKIKNKQPTNPLAYNKITPEIKYNSNITFVSDDTYILIKDNPKLLLVEKKKNFIKNSKEYFEKCPKILEDLENDIITLKDLSSFIEYYKSTCLNN